MKKSLALRAGLPALSSFVLCVHAAWAQTPSPRVMPEAVITATRVPQDPALLPMGVSVITAQEIRAAGVADASEAIRWLAGVVTRIDTTGGRNPTLDLRGFGETAASNLVIMVDGVRQNEGDMAGASISWIPVDSIERIEIVRGSGAVLHGEGATAGMINIVTGKGMNEAGRSASLGLGTQSTRDGRVEVRTVSDAWRYQLYGAAYNSDNHRDNFKVQERNLLMRANWAEGDKLFSAQMGVQSQQGGLPGGINVAEFQTNPRQSFKPQDRGNTDTANLLLSAELPLQDWRVGMDWNHRQIESRGDYIVDDYISKSKTQADRLGLRSWRSSPLWGAQGRFVVGLDAERWAQEKTLLGTGWGSNVKIAQSSDALYARQELDWQAPGLKAFAGARRTQSYREATGDSKGTLDAKNNSWELGVAQRVTTRSEVYLRVGTSFRLPNADEFSCSFGCPPNTLNLLNPQTSRDHELGYRQRLHDAYWTVRYYRSDLRDEIGLGADQFTNMNYDPTRREGVELETKTQWTAAVRTGVQVAQRRSTFREGMYAGKKVPLAPDQSLTLNTTYQMSATQQWVLLTQWVATQKIAGDLDNTCAQSIPGYGVTHVRYNHQVEKWTLSAQVSNLSDHAYYDYRTRCSATSRSIYPQPGRVWMFTARHNF